MCQQTNYYIYQNCGENLMKNAVTDNNKKTFPVGGVLFAILATYPGLFMIYHGITDNIFMILLFLSFVAISLLLLMKCRDIFLAIPFALLAFVSAIDLINSIGRNFGGMSEILTAIHWFLLFFSYIVLMLIILIKNIPALKKYEPRLNYAKPLFIFPAIIAFIISVILSTYFNLIFSILQSCAIIFTGQWLLSPFSLRKKELSNTLQEEAQTEVKEYRMRCNVCGKIFCYSTKDLAKNKEHSKAALWSSVGSIAGALGGGMYHSYEQGKMADKAIDKIVDYSKCPACHSSDIAELTDEEWKKQKKQESTAKSAPVSPADELKKFKELFDSGVISQEEFDAKKKQLLGL